MKNLPDIKRLDGTNFAQSLCVVADKDGCVEIMAKNGISNGLHIQNKMNS